MAPHSSTLAWKIPWMEEPGRLQSMGSLRVGHDWVTSVSLQARQEFQLCGLGYLFIQAPCGQPSLGVGPLSWLLGCPHGIDWVAAYGPKSLRGASVRETSLAILSWGPQRHSPLLWQPILEALALCVLPCTQFKHPWLWDASPPH